MTISHTGVNLPSHMTDEERVLLMQKVDGLFTSAYDDPGTINPDTAELLLIDYVNSLLAARAQEIERLQARQITDELEQMCEDFIGQRDAESYPMSQREESTFARSIGLKLVRWVEARQETEESDT